MPRPFRGTPWRAATATAPEAPPLALDHKPSSGLFAQNEAIFYALEIDVGTA